MTNHPPLNPDGVLHAMDTLMAETDADERATEWAHKVTTRVLEGYFAVAQPVVNSAERQLCVCGKQVTLKKDGTFRSHDGNMPLGPGSRFKARCEGSGEKP